MQYWYAMARYSLYRAIVTKTLAIHATNYPPHCHPHSMLWYYTTGCGNVKLFHFLLDEMIWWIWMEVCVAMGFRMPKLSFLSTAVSIRNYIDLEAKRALVLHSARIYKFDFWLAGHWEKRGWGNKLNYNISVVRIWIIVRPRRSSLYSIKVLVLRIQSEEVYFTVNLANSACRQCLVSRGDPVFLLIDIEA